MPKEWFETWFDTPYYHQLYCHRDHAEAERFIDKMLGFLQLPKESQVLDVGCGKGRHSIYMAEQGLFVTGIDLSAQSIASAQQFATDSLAFHVADMRTVFKENAFDLVVNLFSSFGYFESDEEDYKALEAMYIDCKKGGYIVLDYMNPEKIIKDMKAREIINREDIQFHIQKKIEFPFIVKSIDFLAEGTDHHFEERLKIIKLEQFRKMFAKLNAEIVAKFGDYELHPFDPKTSPRQIWIVKV